MTSIQDLASCISEHVEDLSKLLQQNNIPPPSFVPEASEASTASLDRPQDAALRNARVKILNAAQDLVQLVRGPTEHILTLAWSASDTANLDIINRLNLPQLVPVNSSIELEKLSNQTGVPPDYLARILRFSIANGIFVEEKPGVFCHSAVSAALAQSPYLGNVVRFGTEFLGGILVKTPDYIEAQRADTANAPKTAFNIAYNTDKDLFEYFQKHAGLTDQYHKYLEGRVNTPLWSVDRLRAAWPWASQGDVVFVDVGGSSGHTVRSLAPLMPTAKFIVQDSNLAALEMGRRAVEADADLASRITFTEYDFFSPQPVQADIYMLRHILHDWSDQDSVRILSSLLPSLKPGAKILISEGTLPPPPATRLNTLPDKMIRIEDAFMLAAHDAKERSVADFETLFDKVRPSTFRLVGVTSGSPDGAFQSLLEFEYVG
ncbi:hypothetical protein HIM_01195 [Hirsutella minnesotensis 3608]|nr:hypothetical protein HIM_01195 [Hirsutella minnesotensis 3608]